MKKPYINALILPFFLSPLALCFRKKLTVIGIIGNTQGVKVTNKPANKVPKNKTQILTGLSFFGALSLFSTFALATEASPFSMEVVSVFVVKTAISSVKLVSVEAVKPSFFSGITKVNVLSC